jgi:hypothetical protein
LCQSARWQNNKRFQIHHHVVHVKSDRAQHYCR